MRVFLTLFVLFCTGFCLIFFLAGLPETEADQKALDSLGHLYTSTEDAGKAMTSLWWWKLVSRKIRHKTLASIGMI